MNRYNDIENINDRQWEIIAKHLNNEQLSAEEKLEFGNLATNEEVQKAIRQARKSMKRTGLFFELKKYDTEKAWNKVSNQLDDSKKRGFNTTMLYRVAAVALILITLGVATWQLTSKKGITEIVFATGETDLSTPEVTLPDGTKVLLNHGSKLTYPSEFNGKTREVSLTGEAFFEVTPNKEKPFIIRTKEASVKVLGTSFNVYAYNDLLSVEVAVKTGKVELADSKSNEKAEAQKVLLVAGQKGTFDISTRKASMEKAYRPNELSWLTHELEFEYTSLDEAFKTLQRTYNVQLTIDPNVDLTIKLNATFTQQNIDYVMKVIAMTMNLRAEKIGDNKYVIQNKN